MNKIHNYQGRPSTAEEERRQLQGFLSKGKDNAKTSFYLSMSMGIKITGTNEKIRTLAKELLIFDGIPVCSCTRGFFIGNEIEIEEYIENLSARKKGLERDILHLKKILKKYNKPNLFEIDINELFQEEKLEVN